MDMVSHKITVKVNQQEYLVEVSDLNSTPVIAVVDGQVYEVEIDVPGDEPQMKPAVSRLEGQGEATPSQIDTKREPGPLSIAPNEGSVVAPMPGDIVEVTVQAGQEVRIGDSLCVLDAMKMKNVIRSPRVGRIASVEVTPGMSVDYGTVLVTFAK